MAVYFRSDGFKCKRQYLYRKKIFKGLKQPNLTLSLESSSSTMTDFLFAQTDDYSCYISHKPVFNLRRKYQPLLLNTDKKFSLFVTNLSQRYLFALFFLPLLHERILVSSWGRFSPRINRFYLQELETISSLRCRVSV